jgi:hypothetical protein
MPRSGSGEFTLYPGGNPVIPFTTIETAWANPTLDDIAQALTDSLDRTGLGGMLAPFRIADGTIAAPGLAFTNETNLGLYRSSAGILTFVSGGAEIFRIAQTRAMSPLLLEHRGTDVYKYLGQVSWRVSNESGVFMFVPSATIDLEDWDLTKAITLTPAGNLQIPGDLTIDGVFNITITGLATVANLYVPGDAEVGLRLTANELVATTYVFARRFVVGPQITAGVIGAYSADFDAASSQILSLVGPSTISPANIPIGNILRLTLLNTNNTPTFAGVVWPLGVAPNFAAGPLNKSIVVIENDGTDYLASSLEY